MPRSSTPPLALTLGEPAGIGPDIAIAVWRRRAELALPPFYLVAEPGYLAARAARLGVPLPIRTVAPREAEALRIRFDNCDSGLNFARALRDVAVRDQIVKSSADLAPAIRKLLDEVAVGKLTSPDVTPQGIQMYALCAKRENKVDSAATKEAREEMFAEQFQKKSKRYLEYLRKQAMIEVK